MRGEYDMNNEDSCLHMYGVQFVPYEGHLLLEDDGPYPWDSVDGDESDIERFRFCPRCGKALM